MKPTIPSTGGAKAWTSSPWRKRLNPKKTPTRFRIQSSLLTGGKVFFKRQAQTHIAHALELLFELNRPVTMLNAFELLSERDLLQEEMENLERLPETPRRAAVYAHFTNRFLNQPEEQHGGVCETIGNYLQYFLTPEVAEVFCTGESTFNLAAIDEVQRFMTASEVGPKDEQVFLRTIGLHLVEAPQSIVVVKKLQERVHIAPARSEISAAWS